MDNPGSLLLLPSHLNQPRALREIPKIAIVGSLIEEGVPDGGAGLRGNLAMILPLGHGEAEIVDVSGHWGGVGGQDEVVLSLLVGVEAVLSTRHLGAGWGGGVGAEARPLPGIQLGHYRGVEGLAGPRYFPLDLARCVPGIGVKEVGQKTTQAEEDEGNAEAPEYYTLLHAQVIESLNLL